MSVSLQEKVAVLTPQEQSYLITWHWYTQLARQEQKAPPGDWRVWLFLGGRGTGKTRAGAEDVKLFALNNPKVRVGIIAPTFDDGRDVCIEGESGLLEVLPPDSIKSYNKSLLQVKLTNGSRYDVYTAEKPRGLRGPQHHRVWGDEVAEWRYEETWDLMMLGLRLGIKPQAIATGTPKPTKLIRTIHGSPDSVVTQGSTWDNRMNLPDAMFREIMEKYENTTLGEQEIYGYLLQELPGALWQHALIEQHRAHYAEEPPREEYEKIVVGVDPTGSETGSGDETGIVVAGSFAPKGAAKHAFVLADLSGSYTPDQWASQVVDAYQAFEADYVVAETNFGGALVKTTLRTKDSDIPIHTVRAKRGQGKSVRAEPVVALYQQGRVHHVGVFADMEAQMCTFKQDEHPLGADRVDANVYALSDLLLGKGSGRKMLSGNYALS